MELPALSLSESSAYHHALPHLLAMDAEELLRGYPVEAASC
jgi:hypothetical protein